jgi:hypothetical protein
VLQLGTALICPRFCRQNHFWGLHFRGVHGSLHNEPDFNSEILKNVDETTRNERSVGVQVSCKTMRTIVALPPKIFQEATENLRRSN